MTLEQTLVDYLGTALDVPVYAETPAEHGDSYVIIERTGSNRENRIDTITTAFQSYGATLNDAMELNEIVKAAVDSSITLPSISAARFNSDYNFTDTESKQYRYQCVYEITYLG